MRVAGGRLIGDDGAPVVFSGSPNHGQEVVEHRFLVVHYTAGRGLAQTVSWLSQQRAKASAHFVVGRDGRIVQLVDTSLQAWHAGRSRWEVTDAAAFVGLNKWSIGIELDNAGALRKDGAGLWRTYWGQRVLDQDVEVAAHKHGGPERGWHSYTEEQILACYVVCEALIDAYPTIEDVLGHDDIAPGRKLDPGPAFPMGSFRSWLFGRGAG